MGSDGGHDGGTIFDGSKYFIGELVERTKMMGYR